MKKIRNSKFKEKIIIFGGFLNWIFAIGFMPRNNEFGKALIDGVGAFGFFLVALCLPKDVTLRYFGRRAAIAWMSFLIYFSTDKLLHIWFSELDGFNILLLIVPIVVVFGMYLVVSKVLGKG